MSHTDLYCSKCSTEFAAGERYVAVGIHLESCDGSGVITPNYAEATEMFHLRCLPNQIGIEIPKGLLDRLQSEN